MGVPSVPSASSVLGVSGVSGVSGVPGELGELGVSAPSSAPRKLVSSQGEKRAAAKAICSPWACWRSSAGPRRVRARGEVPGGLQVIAAVMGLAVVAVAVWLVVRARRVQRWLLLIACGGCVGWMAVMALVSRI